MGDDFHWPTLQFCVLTRLEDEEEITRVFGVDAEIVHGPFGVGFGVCRQPAFCDRAQDLAKSFKSRHKRGAEGGIRAKRTYRFLFCSCFGTCHVASFRQPYAPWLLHD